MLQRRPERDIQVLYPLAGGVAISGAVGGGRGRSQRRTSAEETAGGRPEEVAEKSEGERHVQVGGGSGWGWGRRNLNDLSRNFGPGDENSRNNGPPGSILVRA